MAVGNCTMSSEDVVVRSPADRRLYRFIQLTNGLCALLVHDPEIYSDEPSGDLKMDNREYEDEDEDDEEEDSEEEEESGEEDDDEDNEVTETKGSAQKKAAAAMCVGMGSFADPYEAQGLAHFLGFQVYFE